MQREMADDETAKREDRRQTKGDNRKRVQTRSGDDRWRRRGWRRRLTIEGHGSYQSMNAKTSDTAGRAIAATAA